MKKHKKLSIEELKSFPGFESFTEEEAESAINNLESLSILFYELFMKCKFHEAAKKQDDLMKEKLNQNVTHLKQENHETEQRHAA